MSFDYKNTYLLFDSGKPGPMFVVPHSGVAFHKPGDFQDDGTHFIGQRLANSKGKAIISMITRERDIGLDFYRLPPTKKLALEYYIHFKNNRKDLTRDFRRRYSWVAANRKEHRKKEKIYKNFWKVVQNANSPTYFIHRQFFNPIRHPSLIDVVPFTCNRKVQSAVRKVNKKYEKIFNFILPFYKKAFFYKSNCILFKDKLENNSGIDLFRSSEPRIIWRMNRFREAIKTDPYIKITYKKNFKGKNTKGLVEHILPERNYPIIQFEISEFLTRRLPDLAVHLIKDIINETECYEKRK
ncbi:MAG: hypothetical protein ISS36_02015 [Candidatus Aenigmarchaeota archaeon]|nr:hypothetical protein [Candidatus Aenigmarchaeota archaeon]